jgi:plasmid stability protein
MKNIPIQDETHRRLKIRSAEAGMTITAIVEEALMAWLDKRSVETYVMETRVNPTGSRETTISKKDPVIKGWKDLSKTAQAKGRMGR